MQQLWTDWQAGRVVPPAVPPAVPQVSGSAAQPRIDTLVPISSPGRPTRPQRVHPSQLARRSLQSAAGRVALIHAVAHIEFNAINLALDAAHRFCRHDLPPEYFGDWVRVAADEARHFGLLNQRLAQLGHRYGELPAHDGLWDMAVRTAHDPLVRMALVPRVLEARGLDVTPGMITRLEQAGDSETAQCLEIILRDEVEHVAIGSRWFRFLCQREGLEPEATFRRLVSEYFDGELRGPFNCAARLQAGFSAAELVSLGAIPDA